jgi:hypothetical protein
MITLRPCRWRDETAAKQPMCGSPNYLHPPNAVSVEFCASCVCADHEPSAPPAPSLPCVHLGESTGAAHAGAAVFACALHGRCVANHQAAGDLRACASCTDHLPRHPFSSDSASMRRKAEAYLAAIPPYPLRRYHGRGVVIAGGGERYFPSLYVTVRALRHVGCRLPIQVWYLGRRREMPSAKRTLLAPYDVECVDADKVRRRHPARRLNGWELKVFATLHSPYEEVLFLDADCYPCRDPEFLFARKDYRTAGAIFWPDMAAIDPRLKWAAFGVPDPRRRGSIESGQFILDKHRCWRPLNLAWHYNDYSDYYYRYCYGDKHTFEVAWARCAQPFVMWQTHAQWSHVAYVHPGPDRRPLFIHRCADKFRFDPHDYVTNQNHAVPAYQRHLPMERECWTWMAELAERTGRTLEMPPFSKGKR